MKIIKSYRLFESGIDNYSLIQKLDIYAKDSAKGSVAISEKEFDEIRKDYCKSWNKTKCSLYRGQSLRLGLGDYIYTNPNKGEERRSIESTNIHLELMSNLPSWKGWPKYNRSVIGTTSKSDAQGYGTVYEIVPFDGSKIVICPETDIWSSFGNRNDSWGGDIDMVRDFLSQIEIDADWWEQDKGNIQTELTNIKDIRNHCIELYNMVPEEITYFIDSMKGFSEKKVTGKMCFDHINNYLFNPIKRGFEVKIYDENFIAPNRRQIFTEGPVLLINEIYV